MSVKWRPFCLYLNVLTLLDARAFLCRHSDDNIMYAPGRYTEGSLGEEGSVEYILNAQNLRCSTVAQSTGEKFCNLVDILVYHRDQVNPDFKSSSTFLLDKVDLPWPACFTCFTNNNSLRPSDAYMRR